jgi:hypothetical protein
MWYSSRMMMLPAIWTEHLGSHILGVTAQCVGLCCEVSSMQIHCSSAGPIQLSTGMCGQLAPFADAMGS